MLQNNTTDTVEVRKEYYASGALWVETPYKNGNMHGIRKWYYESGALMWETLFVNGMMHGIKRGYVKERTSITFLVLYNKGKEVASIRI